MGALVVVVSEVVVVGEPFSVGIFFFLGKEAKKDAVVDLMVEDLGCPVAFLTL